MFPYDVILLKAAEEASEVAEAAGKLGKQLIKSLRFGLDSTYLGKSNHEMVIEDYLSLKDELFDLQVSLLLYNLYLTQHHVGGPDEIAIFGLENFEVENYPAVIQRLSRYLETLDVTLSRMGISWIDAETFVGVIRSLIATLANPAAPTPEKMP